MERHAVDEAVAFAMLRNESRDANRKLLDIAAAVVDGTASWPGYRVARSRQYSTRRWGSAGRKRRRSGGQALHERRPPTDREHGHIDNDGRFVRDEKSATGLWRGSGVVGSVCRGASTVACWTDAEAQDFIGAHGYFRSAGQPNSLLPPVPTREQPRVHDRVPPAGAAVRAFDQPRIMPREGGLTTADVEAIASRVVELLRDESRLDQHLDTTALAIMLRVSGDWVREHAAELGAIRIGDGPKDAPRFELRRVRTALERRRLGRQRAASVRRPGPARPVAGVELLPLPDDPDAAAR